MATRPDFLADTPPTTAAHAVGEENGPVCGRHLVRRGSRRRSGLRRALLAVAAFLASLLIVTLLAGAYGFLRLRQGPFALDLKPQVMAALNSRVGAAYRFDVGETSVGLTDAGPALNLSRLSVSDTESRPILAAPEAAVAVDPLALLVGRITPTRLDIHAVDIRLLILPDGQVAISAGADDRTAIPLARAFGPPSAPATIPDPGTAPITLPPASSTAGTAPAPANAALQALAAAMRTLVDTVTATDSPLNALQRVNVTGRIVLDDRTRGTTTTFQHAALGFDREAGGAAVLTVAADGPAGRWSLKARANAQDGGARSLAVAAAGRGGGEASGLSLDEITLAGGLHSLGFDFDMPVSAKVDLALGADGAVKQVVGTFELGAGYFKLDDPDHEPLLVDSLEGGFHLDRETKALVLDRTVMEASGTSFAMTGRIEFPKTADDPWTAHLDASGVFGAERPGEKPIPISSVAVAARLFPASHRLVIDRTRITGPDVDFDDTAEIRSDSQGVKVHNAAVVRHMPASLLVRLWPSFVAAKVRAWLLVNLKGGTIDNGSAIADLDGDDLKLMHVDAPVADSHVRVTFEVSGLGLNVMAGVPPLTGVDASGVVTGHTFDLQVRHGDLEVSPGRRLTLADGSFTVPDNLPKIMPATVQAHVTGGVDVLADLLSRDALKPYASLPLDPGGLRGQFDGQLALGLKIGDDVPPGQVTISADATATGLAVDKLVGKQGLADATIRLDLDKGTLHARGDGRILGAPASFDLRKPANGAGEAVVTMALDDAARARAGFPSGGALRGVVGAKVTAPIAPGEKLRASVELDFARASIEGLVPGFSKPMGRPGRATLTVVQHDGSTSLDDLVFEGGGAALRGLVDLDRDGGFAGARLSQVKLSPGDDMRVDAQQTSDGLKLSVHAANLDARPFLKTLSASGASGSGEDKTALDLDLHAGILTGQNNQAITGAEFRLSRRGGRTTRVTLSGRLGRQPISIGTSQVDNAPHLLIRAGDAGATLLFLDLYRRMAGGTLDANVALISSTRLDGYVTVHDFTLREDPALRKLAAQGLASQDREAPESEATGATVDPSAMPFRKLEASFTKVGTDMEVRDGSMFGPTLGATVSGRIDFARDQVNLGGTFVPLFGVNNLFSQLPVLGPLLGGNKHEGLVGLSYQITGSAANPVLNVNPFSVLAPGILRQVFGALDPTQPGFLGGPRDRAPTPGARPVEQE